MNSLLLGNRFEKLNKYCLSKYRCSSQTHHSFMTHSGATPPLKRDEREKNPIKSHVTEVTIVKVIIFLTKYEYLLFAYLLAPISYGGVMPVLASHVRVGERVFRHHSNHRSNKDRVRNKFEQKKMIFHIASGLYCAIPVE